jgi:hypothetical protein
MKDNNTISDYMITSNYEILSNMSVNPLVVDSCSWWSTVAIGLRQFPRWKRTGLRPSVGLDRIFRNQDMFVNSHYEKAMVEFVEIKNCLWNPTVAIT